ncbi:MAG: sulfurtransferase-like selenium metabolism protein YedF [Deltaproteobacteria bacterium]|nr:MAG: sulfurtransferase-like selenium metabolism protein YedF [Deltaproteobacteria bacterium]RLB86763.1 MAG: sulfurtransferase-like selenium metabolism protein YedF [Deltaproteobacteria bacterium]
MMKEIDCKGLACPGPVLRTKDVLENSRPDVIKVIVDNEASKQNVKRFLESQNYTVNIETDGSLFHVIGSDNAASQVPDEVHQTPESNEDKKKILVMIGTDRMGYGDDELGKKLMLNFLGTLKEMGEDLWRLVLVNNGVKLTIEGSDALPVLKELAHSGVYILVCGTCLTYFDLLEKKQIGETTNMLDVVTSLQLADKVINL